MPNIIAHMYITTEVNPTATPDDILGSALPDFLGMAQDLHSSSTHLADLANSPFAAGIKLHKATDVVFDNLALKSELVAKAKADMPRLAAENRGAALACADAGTEILLDGVLLDMPGPRVTYDVMRRELLLGRTSLHTISDQLPSGMLEDYFKKDWAAVYDNPEEVARLMYRRLAARPRGRLKFDAGALPEITAAFINQRERLQYVGLGSILVRQTIEGLAATPTQPRFAELSPTN
jgi:hypothetical protein